MPHFLGKNTKRGPTYTFSEGFWGRKRGPGPFWATNSSFLLFRALNNDIPGFLESFTPSRALGFRLREKSSHVWRFPVSYLSQSRGREDQGSRINLQIVGKFMDTLCELQVSEGARGGERGIDCGVKFAHLKCFRKPRFPIRFATRLGGPSPEFPCIGYSEMQNPYFEPPLK